MLRFFIAVLILLALPSCIGKGPFQQIQLCLHDQASTHLFIQTMKEISVAHGMRFIDRSADTSRELTALNANPNYPVMNISGIGNDGIGWAAGNTGLSEFEVSIGFSKGANPPAAHEFANAAIKTLEQTWHIYRVPENQGVFPRCNAQKPNNSFKPTPLRGVGKVS